MSDRPDFAVTTLGSGGPFAHISRASSGYCVWIAGKPSMMFDAGGGTFARIAQIGIAPEEIDTFAITHTHIDHTAGLAPLVFAAVMGGRSAPFCFVGPAGTGDHPGASRFVDLLFGTNGAWNYLHGFERFAYRVHEVPSALDGETIVTIPLETAGVALTAVHVRHGAIPSVAYRIDYAGRSIVYSGDVSEESDALVRLARDCDLLIHDFAVPERHVAYSAMHAPPSAVGRVAARANCKRLLITHIMPELEDELASSVARVRAEFGGPIIEARDLLRIEV